MKTYTETLFDAYGQEFKVDKLYFENRTDHQHLVIFENAVFGRVMALDGIIQTTEADEFIYHEMMTHVPLFAHGNAKDVLIIGGGDGAMLREVCKHPEVERITQVEIDEKVIEMCREYLPNHSIGAFGDPRATTVIDDGMHYVNSVSEQFDVIISDSTDPIGPGEVLFSRDFYQACRQALKPGGILVTQNGVAFLQPDEVESTARRLFPLFADSHFYGASVPTYVGGIMTFAWATDEPGYRDIPLESLQARYAASGMTTRYYNPGIHQASFALPQYILDIIEQAN